MGPTQPLLGSGTAPETPAGERSTRTLPPALWVAQAILAGVLAAAGTMKLSTPLPEVAKTFAWTGRVPPELTGPLVRLGAIAELAAALAVVVPPWNAIVAELSRISASAVALVIPFEAASRLASGDAIASCTSIVLSGLAAFVAWGRSREAQRSADPSGPRGAH